MIKDCKLLNLGADELNLNSILDVLKTAFVSFFAVGLSVGSAADSTTETPTAQSSEDFRPRSHGLTGHFFLLTPTNFTISYRFLEYGFPEVQQQLISISPLNRELRASSFRFNLSYTLPLLFESGFPRNHSLMPSYLNDKSCRLSDLKAAYKTRNLKELDVDQWCLPFHAHVIYNRKSKLFFDLGSETHRPSWFYQHLISFSQNRHNDPSAKPKQESPPSEIPAPTLEPYRLKSHPFDLKALKVTAPDHPLQTDNLGYGQVYQLNVTRSFIREAWSQEINKSLEFSFESYRSPAIVGREVVFTTEPVLKVFFRDFSKLEAIRRRFFLHTFDSAYLVLPQVIPSLDIIEKDKVFASPIGTLVLRLKLQSFSQTVYIDLPYDVAIYETNPAPEDCRMVFDKKLLKAFDDAGQKESRLETLMGQSPFLWPLFDPKNSLKVHCDLMIFTPHQPRVSYPEIRPSNSLFVLKDFMDFFLHLAFDYLKFGREIFNFKVLHVENQTIPSEATGVSNGK